MKKIFFVFIFFSFSFFAYSSDFFFWPGLADGEAVTTDTVPYEITIYDNGVPLHHVYTDYERRYIIDNPEPFPHVVSGDDCPVSPVILLGCVWSDWEYTQVAGTSDCCGSRSVIAARKRVKIYGQCSNAGFGCRFRIWSSVSGELLFFGSDRDNSTYCHGSDVCLWSANSVNSNPDPRVNPQVVYLTDTAPSCLLSGQPVGWWNPDAYYPGRLFPCLNRCDYWCEPYYNFVTEFAGNDQYINLFSVLSNFCSASVPLNVENPCNCPADVTPTSTPTVTPVLTPVLTPYPSPTYTPGATGVPTVTPNPTIIPSPVPDGTPLPYPSPEPFPTLVPPDPQPTAIPPSDRPDPFPTLHPTDSSDLQEILDVEKQIRDILAGAFNDVGMDQYYGVIDSAQQTAEAAITDFQNGCIGFCNQFNSTVFTFGSGLFRKLGDFITDLDGDPNNLFTLHWTMFGHSVVINFSWIQPLVTMFRSAMVFLIVVVFVERGLLLFQNIFSKSYGKE